ncbi:transposase, partial [Klebsiella pneumoniae]|uniref:integrase core domain-containing protein n=1 Tax=Klebsiella pneumoniae TaxID=573 RepID=UPI0029647876
FITVSVGMVRVIICHQLNTKNNIISGSEVSRLSVAIQNAFIERFNRTYRTEILDFYLFRTLNEAREITERWLAEYNGERPHESLNNLTPEEYRLMAETPEISKSAWN